MERWVDEINDWETRSVDDGYRGLQSLASAEFSGAVSAGGTWLFMVKGRGVGAFEYRQQPSSEEVIRGDIEQFENADLTAYTSPHPAVPMLVAMQAGETETRGRYYTEDTPIREVHDTLQDGGFTGYLELSENVLSGDYYVVYQGGRSMEVAFIGNSRRLETDDDAFDRAANEVGIYEVVSADLQPVDIPEPKNKGGAAGAAGLAGATGADAAGDTETDDSSDPDLSEPAQQNEPTKDDSATSQDTTATTPSDRSDARADDASTGIDDATASETAPSTDAARSEPSAETDEKAASQGSDTTPDTSSHGEKDGTEAPSDQTETPESPSEAPMEPTETESGVTDARTDEDPSTERDTSGAASDARESIVNREVPSLDPERSGVSDDVADSGIMGSQTSAGRTSRDSRIEGQDRVSDLEVRLADRESELEDARVRLEEARADLDRVQKERDELRSRVSELEAELKELRAAVDAGGVESTSEDTPGATTANRGDSKSLSPAQAMSETNLFVRYRSKGKTTLDDVHDGADPDALADNLRLEHHTEFEDEGATVEGEPFEAWLHNTVQFRFLRWLTTILPFEIRDTGATNGLAALYTALPKIDRVELAGNIEVDTTDGPREVEFDVVVRDRMGEALAVARFDNSREPVTETQLADLLKSTTDVAERIETLASAFFVAKSYFDPDALDTAREATSGSLLSRDKRRSFVKLSRNQGYHLCLVEARGGDFHLSVPDL